MASFVDVASGALAKASDVQQILDALKGTIGKGIPLSSTAVNDAIAFAFSAKNLDATNSRAGIFYKADGSVLLQIDKNGVQASPDGSLAAAPVLTTSSAIGASQIAATAWTAFTPTLTQGAALTLTTANGRYAQVGKTVLAMVEIVIGSTGTAAQIMVLGGLPVASHAPSVSAIIADGWYWHLSPDAVYTLEALRSGTTGASFASGSGGASSGFGIAPAVTAASGDRLALKFQYEAA